MNTQNFANKAWAFAVMGQQDEQLFKALERMAELRLVQFNAQDFANTAWALAMANVTDSPSSGGRFHCPDAEISPLRSLPVRRPAACGLFFFKLSYLI